MQTEPNQFHNDFPWRIKQTHTHIHTHTQMDHRKVDNVYRSVGVSLCLKLLQLERKSVPRLSGVPSARRALGIKLNGFHSIENAFFYLFELHVCHIAVGKAEKENNSLKYETTANVMM